MNTTFTSLKILSILALSLFSFTIANAQILKSVKGVLQDSTGASIISATIKLTSQVDTLYSTSDIDGNFAFKNVRSDRFQILINSLGYETFLHDYQFSSNQIDLGKITMKTGSELLQEVTIEGSPLIVVKEDTLEYRAKDYNLRDNAVTEDLLKKLDGVEVKDGNIQAQGEAITRVRINGKDFFGGDVKTATKNLPADIIERIQIVDDYGDQANLTGNRSGDPERVLNIEISPDKNRGDFGTFRVGGGNEDRYQGTASYNSFTETRQFSVLGNLNNVNAPLFDFQTRGSGARRGRGGGGFGGGFGGNQNGLTDIGSVGVNYRKTLFNEKLTTYGNYSFSRSDNTTLRNDYNEYDYKEDPVINSLSSKQNNIRNNHRFDWNFEYRPNEQTYFKLSPTFSINNSDATSVYNEVFRTDNVLNNTVSRKNINDSRSPSLGISGLINRRLNDKGRNIFVNFSIDNSKSLSDRDEIVNTISYLSSDNPDSLYQRQLIDLNNKRLNGGVSFSYTEPFNDKSGIELAYDYNTAKYDNSRMVFDSELNDVITPKLENSNIYDYSFNTNRFSLTYRYRGEKLIYSIGASAQPSSLQGNTVVGEENIKIRRTAVNYMPVARFEYKFSRTKGLNISYFGRSNEPGFSQLQPIKDVSNPQFPIIGNPNLDAEFIHNVRLRYNNFNTQSGTTFFAMLSGSKTDNKIVTNRVSSLSDLYGRVQETSYLNTDGFYNTQGFYSFSKAFDKRKYVISANGSARFSNNVSFVDDEKNFAKNWILSQGLNVQVNLGEWLELMPGINYTFNTTKNTVSSRPAQDVSTWSMNLNSKVYIVPTLLWAVELSKLSNNGYSSNIGASPFIINSYLEKELFKGKQGAIRFHAFDILDQQVNISRTITDNGRLDSRTNRLARYFMLSLTYKFQKFGGVNAAPERSREWGRGPNMRNH